MTRPRTFQDRELGTVHVTTSPYLRAGTAVGLGNPLATVVLGTRPWDEIEVAGERARRTVRHGLADVLRWLGEPVGPHPDNDPYPAVSGEQLLERWRRP